MLLKAYSVRDSKADYFNPPFYQKTHGEAERSFHKLSQDKQTNISQYPEDFDLWFIGEFDDSNGKFTALATPQHIAKAVLAQDLQHG